MATAALNAPAGATKNKKIVGRGRSSGSGKTCGRGHKGQNSRSGGGVRLGFEGGQMPLYRRVASRGFSNHRFKKVYKVINVGRLDELFSDGDVVSASTLVAKGLTGKNEKNIKILGSGELTKSLTIKIATLSGIAKEKILGAGGTVG